MITAFFGTAWGKAMWAARRAARSALNSSGSATVHAVSHRAQPVHLAKSTNVGFRRRSTEKPPVGSGETWSTSV